MFKFKKIKNKETLETRFDKIKKSLQNEIKDTKSELNNLETALIKTTENFYKELCENKDDDGPDIKTKREKIFMEIIAGWINDVHDIEAIIIKQRNFLLSEAMAGLNSITFKKIEDERPTSQMKTKRLQSGHNYLKHKISEITTNTSCSGTHSIHEDITRVKTNRTLQLRKAETMRRRQQQSNDPYYAKPLKRNYKKLDKYIKEPVYNRLTETTTIAYDQRQAELKRELKTKATYPSLHSIISKTLSVCSSGPQKSIKSGKQRSVCQYVPSKQSKIPLPTARLPPYKRQSSPPKPEWTCKQKRFNDELSKLDEMPLEKNLITSDVDNWKSLGKKFSKLPDARNDTFLDVKSSIEKANKIYGSPRQKASFSSFLKRNFHNKKEKKEGTSSSLSKSMRNKITNEKYKKVPPIATMSNNSTIPEKKSTVSRIYFKVLPDINDNSKKVAGSETAKLMTNKEKIYLNEKKPKSATKAITSTKQESSQNEIGSRKSKSDHTHVSTSNTSPSKHDNLAKVILSVKPKSKLQKQVEKERKKEKSQQAKNSALSKSETDKERKTQADCKDDVNQVHSEKIMGKITDTSAYPQTYGCHELDVKPSEQHVFTKFSGNYGQQLARLEEKFAEHKAHVEDVVKRNHKDKLWESNPESDSLLPKAKKQTELLRQHIAAKRRELISGITDDDDQLDEWPYSHVPGFRDSTINTDP